MKKIVLMAVMAIVSLTANAQAYVGGQFGFGVSKTRLTGEFQKGQTSTDVFKIAPEVGYNFNKKVAIGMSAGIGLTSVTDMDHVTEVAVSPYFRYKFVQSGPITVFSDVVAEWSSTLVKDETASAYGIGLRPGVSVDLGKNWSAAATTILFAHQYWADDEISRTQFNINPSQLSVGFYYNF